MTASKIIEEMAAARAGKPSHKRRFADGGKVEEAQRLLAEIQAKYGAPAAEQAPQPRQQPAPVQPPKQEAGSLLQRAAGLFGNRGKQIDKAAGYADGGEVGGDLTDDQLARLSVETADQRRMQRHRRHQRAEILDSVIKGPGTSTSDSIPAKIKETGEPILVSNGERILSRKQDQLLGRIAEMLGYETVDELLESGTGRPVGPTLKSGKRAAEYGKQPETVETLNNGPYTGDGASLIDDFKKWQGNKIAETNAKIDLATGKLPSASYSNEGRSVPAPVTNPANHPVSVPASRPGALLRGDVQPKTTITAESAQAAYGNDMQRSGGVFGTYDGKGVNDIMARENKARGEMIDSMIQAQGGNGIGILPDRTNEPNIQMQLNKLTPQEFARYQQGLEANDTARYGHDITAQRAAGHDSVLMRGQDINAQTELVKIAGNPLENKRKQVEVADLEQLAGLRGRLLDPNTTPEEQKRIASLITAVQGKQEKPASLQAIDVEEPIDPKQPLLGNRKIPYVFDPRTGQSRPMLQGTTQQQDPVSQARAAIARGADPAKVNARLKQLGYQEIS